MYHADRRVGGVRIIMTGSEIPVTLLEVESGRWWVLQKFGNKTRSVDYLDVGVRSQ
jgi:hypothetical protein